MFKSCLFAFILAFLLIAHGNAAQINIAMKDSLKVSSNGIPFIQGDTVVLMDSNWKIIGDLRHGKAANSTSPEGVAISEWSSGEGTLIRKVRSEEGAAILEYEFTFKKDLPGKYIEVCLHIPKAAMNIPEDSVPKGSFKTALKLETLGGIITLDPEGTQGGEWALNDLRKTAWSGQFRLIFSTQYDKEKGFKGYLRLKIKAEDSIPAAFSTIDMDKAAGRRLSDNDSKSGWTGQGPENDLSRMKTGILVSGGVPFQITDKAVVLKSSNTPDFPKSSGIIPLKIPVKADFLYFLQTAAWQEKLGTSIANYKISYEDGSSASLPIRYGYDVSDWWNAQNTLNGTVAWKGNNRSGHEVAVYMMKAANPSPEKKIAGIEVVSTESACTAIVLAITTLNLETLGKDEQKLLDNAFLASSEKSIDTSSWYQCPIDWDGKIKEGTAIDFSFMNHKPAGKLGFLKRVGDHFEFENQPNVPVRFWGTNFAIEGPFPDKNLAPGIARTMAAQGVNLVRIHLYAARPTLLQSADGGLNPEMLDKMFFLISELKKNGIYIYMDFNDGHCYDLMLKRPSTFNPEEWLKFCSLFDPELKKSTKRLGELLFTTVNPYTGKSMAEDPAIAMFEIMNEVSMLFNWRPLDVSLKGKEKYRESLNGIWQKWLAENQMPSRELPKDFSFDLLGRRFGTEMDKAYLHEMKSYLRSLGIKVPVAGTNITFSNSNLIASEEMDFMADHDYWAHPDFKNKPMNYPDISALSRNPTASVTGKLGNCALKGYPVVHGEWNYCYPNSFRCEGIPLASAYAAYQDWDGMIFYGATGSCDDGKWKRFTDNPSIMVHSQQTDPATWGLSQIGAAIFRRGDVKAADRILNVAVGKNSFENDTMTLAKMPFLTSLGRLEISFPADGIPNELGKLLDSGKYQDELYAEVLNKIGDSRSDMNRIISDTKELRRYSTPSLLFIDTACTQSISGRLSELPAVADSLKDVQINSRARWGSLNFVSIDGLPVKDSKRILLVAVGNAANSGQRCEGGFILDFGKAPVLAEPLQADFSIRSTMKNPKIYALDSLSGERKAELKSIRENGQISFSIDGSEKTIYFEITEN